VKLRPVENPPNPYATRHAEWLEPPPAARLEIYEETSGSILSRNDSPDLPFTWSVNPYRGCQHACAYCYARPYHEYIDLGAGTDFDTKLIVKRNAPELLRRSFARKKWKGELVMFSGITDCYQPIEAAYGLTRRGHPPPQRGRHLGHGHGRPDYSRPERSRDPESPGTSRRHGSNFRGLHHASPARQR